MNKGLWGAGFGLLTLLGGLYYVGIEKKEEVQMIDPAMEAGYKGADAANLANLNMARTMYMTSKGKAPEKAEDLIPEFLPAIPAEAFSKSNLVVSTYDGSGGWVLDGDGFRPNHPQKLSGP